MNYLAASRTFFLIAVLLTGPAALADHHAALIEARQEKLKEMGAAMKVFREELKREAPDLQRMERAAARIASYAPELKSWFPAGTGPASGINTDALAYIWKNTDKFTRVSSELVPAADALVVTIGSGETASIAAAVGTLGRACKACHQSFRAD